LTKIETSTSQQSYRPDIDGLRAAAVLSVLGFHAFPTVFPSGFIGVDIFFVISGFLISSIIFKGLAEGSFSFTDFYSRRIKRIFPALLIVLLTCFVVGWFVLLPDELKQLGKHMAAGAGFGSNLMLLSESGYFDNLSDTKPLLHLWSLGIEEQFYIAWPLLLWLVWKRRINLFATIFGLLLLSFLLNVGMIHKHAVSVFYMPQTRVWELLVGALLACIQIHGQIHRETNKFTFARSFSTLSPHVWSSFGVLLISVSYFLLSKDKRFPGWWALLPTLGAAGIIAGGQQAWFNRKVLAHPVMVWIGLISFPLYLWHWPLLSFARIVQSETPSIEIRLSALALSFVLAWLTFVLVERRVRHQKNKTVTVVLIIMMVLTGFLGYNCFSRDGYRFRENIKKLEQQNNGFNWDDIKNYDQTTANDPPNLKRDVMLVGDSHAQAIFAGFSEVFKQHQTRLQIKASAACPPFYDLTVQHIGHEEQCKDEMNGYLDAIIKDESIKTVILSSRGPLYLTGHGFGDIDMIHLMIKSSFANAKSNEDYTDVFSDAMSRTLTMLTKANKKIFFMVDVPELGFEPEQCVDVRPYKLVDNKKSVCAITKDVYLKRNASYLNIVAQHVKTFPNVKFLHPSSHLCDEQFCYAKKGDIIFYRDDDHLSYAGSLRMAQLLEKELF
jgi:peptidoglycan/LPS O-acetylase OafA/YrhL